MNNLEHSDFVKGFLLGTLLGAVVAVLVAPDSGEATRRQLHEQVSAIGQRGYEFPSDKLHETENLAIPEPSA